MMGPIRFQRAGGLDLGTIRLAPVLLRRNYRISRDTPGS